MKNNKLDTNKYAFEIRTANGSLKFRKNEGLHLFMTTTKKIFLVFLAAAVAFSISFAFLKLINAGVDECYAENSHLTAREQKAICTLD